jgi:hypothetical protein
VVLQGCYRGVTVVLQWCYSGFKVVLQCVYVCVSMCVRWGRRGGAIMCVFACMCKIHFEDLHSKRISLFPHFKISQ